MQRVEGAGRLAPLTSGGVPLAGRGMMEGAPSRVGGWDRAPYPESVQLSKQGELPRQTAEV